MNKFINIVLGLVLVVFAVMNCVLVNDLEKATKELVEVYNIEPELIIVDSLVWDTCYITKTEVVSLPIYRTDTILTTDTIVAVDSVYVEIPISTYHYDTTLSETHISLICEGFDVRLNSLLIENFLSVPTQGKQAKTKDFGLGLSLGVGATKDGFSPYIGIGLYYKLL